MVHRYCKGLLPLVALALLALPWIRIEDASGGHGECRHDCRCSRLLYFDRLLPPNVPGKGGDALGSVQRMVGVLMADPETDWGEIRLTRLRDHLVDLNEIMMSARAEERDVDGGIEVTVGGSERTLAALRRVVPEHVRRMDGFRGWNIAIEDAGESLRVVIRSDKADEVEVVRAVGFFGFLASGVHHPENHLAVVKGLTVVKPGVKEQTVAPSGSR